MRYLAERGQGFATAGGPVPIVPAACIFDLSRRRRAARRPPTATTPRSSRRGDEALRDRARRRGHRRDGRQVARAGRRRRPVASVSRSTARRRCSSLPRWRWSTRSATSSRPTARSLAGSTAPGRRPRFPDARAVRGGAGEHDPRRRRHRRAARQGGLLSPRAERPRRLRPRAAPGAHPLRRRHRLRRGDRSGRSGRSDSGADRIARRSPLSDRRR